MSDQEFQKWLESRHAGLVTPSELVASHVQKAVGSKPERSARVIIGTDHEVYDVTTIDGQKVIVRIAHHDDHRLEAEKWALDASRAKGVPTPKVLLLEKSEHSGKSLVFCVEEKIPGKALNELIDEGGDISAILPQVGEILGKIHSVPIEGFGYLQPDGKGWPISWSDIMLDLVPKRADLLATADKENVETSRIEQGLDVLNAHNHLYDYNEPVLVHGDFLPEHILVADEQVTGIIDMQQCSGNHPIFDFTSWEADNLAAAPASLIYENYPHKQVFNGQFELLLHLATVRHLMWMLMVHSKNQERRGLEITKNGLDASLAFFNK